MADSKDRSKKNYFPNKTKEISIAFIILIVAIWYSLFFYLQDNTERSVRNNLFEQQKQRQIESTKDISEHIRSDFDSIITRLQSLANSVYLQQGDFSSNKTRELVQETYLQMNMTTKADRLFILGNSDMKIFNIIPKAEESFLGENFSFHDWVKQTENTLMPVFSNGFQGADGKFRIAISYPIINRDTGKYIGLVGASIPTIQFFERYGNIYNIKSQYLAVLDHDSVQLIHPVKSLVGTPFFGNYTQQLTGHNRMLNNLILKVMTSNQPSFAVYDFINGQRLNTGYPVFIGQKPTYFLFVITPTALIYSQIDNILLTQRIEAFGLLAGITAAIAVLILFLIKWNSTLDRAVKIKTKEVDESNEQLSLANKQLATANEQLTSTSKLQKEFINIVAHELRTPTQSILGYAEILELEPEKCKQHIIPILRNAKRLQKLIVDILDVARIESHTLSLDKEKFNINEKIRNVVNDLKEHGRSEEDIKISFVKPTEDPIIVKADKIRIYEVISNLLINATKFTKKSSSGQLRR